MTFKPKIWYPIAVVMAVANLIAVGIYSGEPWHAMAHGALSVAFGLWAQHLRRARAESQTEERSAAVGDERLEVLEDELSRLRQELSETQERLDFTERMLAQRPDPHRVEPQR